MEEDKDVVMAVGLLTLAALIPQKGLSRCIR